MDDAAELGRRLAEGHVAVDGYVQAASLINYAESNRHGDWSCRSALVRLAQAEPALVGALLEVIRRLDATLHHVTSILERHVVASMVDGRADVRAADLGRLAATGVDVDGLLSGYEAVVDLEPEERQAVPLLAIAAEMDALGDKLAAWAADPVDPAPVAVIDQTRLSALARLDALGVPAERWTGPQGRR